MYESTVNFTLDTICPWTYLAKRRLDEALRRIRDTEDVAAKVKFTVIYHPYQLYPEASQEGEDKYEWYKKSRYGDSEDKMKMYITLMTAHGVSAGIDYKFGGTVANTLQSHRVIQYFQSHPPPSTSSSNNNSNDPSTSTADKLINSLYRQYFEEEKHPSSHETLLAACAEVGIETAEAKRVVEDEELGLDEVKDAMREQRGNGIDSVPYVSIEGRRRDLTFVGAKTVEEYVKGLLQIVKESG